MKFFVTFNEKMYQFSGKKLIQTIQTHMPSAEIIAYDESDSTIDCLKTVKVCDTEAFKQVFNSHKDVITEQFGGQATIDNLPGDGRWNIRWFGWFRKVAMAHHAICVEKHKGYLVFLDCDNRLLSPIDEPLLERSLNGNAVGYFQGSRSIPETGIVVVDGSNPQSQVIYEEFMNVFLSGEFRSLAAWDDCSTMQLTRQKLQGKGFIDIAKDRTAKMHTNSNGHATGQQIIAATEWGKYIEHDKGIHWRNNVVPSKW